jgi:hypothetical protein
MPERERKQNFCRFEEPVEITLLTPTRIEGSTTEFPSGEEYDCKKCQMKGAAKPVTFAWIAE